MNILSALATVGLCLVVCLVSLASAGGDKSAKTTVITLAGGGEKHGGGYPVPIPIPVCTGGHRHHGGHHGGGHHHHHFGAQARMGWVRR